MNILMKSIQYGANMARNTLETFKRRVRMHDNRTNYIIHKQRP